MKIGKVKGEGGGGGGAKERKGKGKERKLEGKDEGNGKGKEKKEERVGLSLQCISSTLRSQSQYLRFRTWQNSRTGLLKHRFQRLKCLEGLEVEKFSRRGFLDSNLPKIQRIRRRGRLSRQCGSSGSVFIICIVSSPSNYIHQHDSESFAR